MKRNKNIYEMFGCKDKLELYQLIKKEPEKLQDLLGFFNIWKGTKIVQRESLNSVIKLRDFVSGFRIPRKGESWILFADTKLKPIYAGKIAISNQEELRREMVNGIHAGATAVFLYYPKSLESDGYFHYFQEQFKLFDLGVIDEIVYKRDTYHKKNVLFSVREGSQVEYKRTNKYHKFSEADGNRVELNEFLQYYGKQEIMGLNIQTDREKIKEILKTAYQNQTQERFGYIAYDESGKIYEVEEIFAGTRDRSLIDTKVLIDRIYREEEMKGIAVFHNHPSGDYTPSPDDDMITQKLFALAAHMDYEFADHMIAAKEGVYSYAEQNPNISQAIGQFARLPQVNEKNMEYDTETEKNKNEKLNTQRAEEALFYYPKGNLSFEEEGEKALLDQDEKIKAYIDTVLEDEDTFTVTIERSEYNYFVEMTPWLNDFKYSNGKSLTEYNPFRDAGDVVQLHFYKNSNDEYRVFFTDVNPVMFYSDVEMFINDTRENALKEDDLVKKNIKEESLEDVREKLFETLKNDKDLLQEVLKAREILGNHTLADFSSVFQREYTGIMREVAERQGDLPDDMKSLDNIKKLQIEIEDKYRKYLDDLSNEKEHLENTQEIKEKIAVKVGYYYAVVDKERVNNIELEETGIKVYPGKDNVEGKVYPLYREINFEESSKIDKLFDEIAVSMKKTNLTDLNDEFYLNKQGLYEIERDTVTEEKDGYDFYISSLGKQFPNYYEDIYVSNKNLKIDGVMQNIAYIGKDNQIKFNVNLPEDEKEKVLEIRNKKEILSSLNKNHSLKDMIKDAKKEIINFCNREYNGNHSYNEFDALYSDLKHIGIAYTETPDEKHHIEYVLNLKEYKATLLVDDIPIRIEEYHDKGEPEEMAIKAMIEDLKGKSFEDVVKIKQTELEDVLGLKIDDNGNFYEEKRITYDLER